MNQAGNPGIPMFQPGQPGQFNGQQTGQFRGFQPNAGMFQNGGRASNYSSSSNYGGTSPVTNVQAHLAQFTPQASQAQFAETNASHGMQESSGLTSEFPTAFSGNYQYATTSKATQPWYFDSGATNHITNTIQNIEHPQPVVNNPGVMVGNGTNLHVTHTGKGILPTPNATFQLSNVLHTPHITHNLLSVHHFAKDNNCLLIFDSSGLVIQDKTSLKILYKGPCLQGLYPLQSFSKHMSGTSSSPTGLIHTNSPSTTLLWHQKLGHPSLPLFHALIKQHELPVSVCSVMNCNVCNQAKSHKLAFPLSVTRSTVPFELIHMDVWGPSPVPSHKGFRFYLVIVDDFSRYT